MSVANTHHWRFCITPVETWDAMYQDCVDATKSVALEQYIFENDEIGQKFLRLFIHKAKAGVDVRLLCDGVGSRSLKNSPLVEELRASGGQFRFYNSLKWIDLIKPRHIFPRTHVKVLIIDATIAYVGGVCIDQRMENWRDTQIRITGPVVEEIKTVSDCNFSDFRRSKPYEKRVDSDFAYLQSAPRFFRHPIYRALLEVLDHANSYVYLSAAFFVPTRRLRRVLKQAASRGVKIVLLIPEHSDSHIADLACLSYAKRLIKSGVRIWRYQPTILHNKTAVIDGIWGTIGSSNMDALSFFHNREANLVIRDKEALARMEKDFLNDLRSSRELTLDFLEHIPLWKRAAMHMARLCRSFL